MTATAVDKTEHASERLESGSVERDFFLDLPEDVRRLLLCSYLGPQGTVNLSACSSTLRALCKHDDLWKDFCCKELGVKPSQLELPPSYTVRKGKDCKLKTQIGSYRLETGPVLSYWQLYSQLLYPFRGSLQKLLVSYTSAYGDILTLTYAKGRITGEVWWPPMKLTDSMKPLVDFVVCLDRDGNPMVVHGFARDGDSTVSLPANSLQKHIGREAPPVGDGPADQDSGWIFGFRCRFADSSEDPAVCRTDRGALRRRLLARIEKDGISSPDLRSSYLALDKFESFLTGKEFTDDGIVGDIIATTQGCCGYKHRVETIPGPVVFSTGLVLPLGFFKGTYGPFGNKLIKMEYASDTRNLRGIVLTGDANVPAGQIAFQFPIDHALVLSVEQQQDMDFLTNVHQTGPFHALDRLPDTKQPLRIPTGLKLLYTSHVGDTCQFRLTGQATLAERGFVNPMSSIAQIIVFSPEKFVVFWLGELNFAALFLEVASNDVFCAYY